MQLQARYAELQRESKKEDDGLPAALKTLQKQSHSKKAEFIRWMEMEGIGHGNHETMAMLYSKAEQALTERYEPVGSELMKFGKYANISYQEVIEMYPSYTSWCRTTLAEEDQTSWRLKRFVMFANQTEAAKKTMMKSGRAQTEPTEDKGTSISCSRSDSHFSVVGGSSSQTAMQETMNENAALKSEVAELKEMLLDATQQTGRSKNRKEM